MSSIALGYAPVGGYDDSSEEDISSVIRNPSPPKSVTRRASELLRSILPLLGLVALVIFGFRVLRRNEDFVSVPHEGLANDLRLQSYESLEDAVDCKNWPNSDDSEPHLSTVSFELPGEADLLFFLSRGPTSGQFHLIQAPGYSSSTTIDVNVTAQYIDRTDLERSKACRVGNDSENEHGVLVGSPQHLRYGVKFNITVALPQSLKEYKDISTDLPHFTHHGGSFFDIWSPSAFFETIRFKSSNASIDIGAMLGESAYVETSNAYVQGFFAGTKSLAIQTSNAFVRSTAMMLAQAIGSETSVDIHTSNAPVEAFLSVMSDYDEPKLTANIHTSNGVLTAVMPRFPFGLNSSFHLDASTSNALTEVILHPDYEGTFDLVTTWANARVLESTPDPGDPSGKGRKRTLRKTKEGQHTQGYMFWSRDGGQMIMRARVGVQSECIPRISLSLYDVELTPLSEYNIRLGIFLDDYFECPMGDLCQYLVLTAYCRISDTYDHVVVLLYSLNSILHSLAQAHYRLPPCASVSQVCSEWRRAALGYPRLWTRVYPNYHWKWVKEMVEHRSGPAPLCAQLDNYTNRSLIQIICGNDRALVNRFCKVSIQNVMSADLRKRYTGIFGTDVPLLEDFHLSFSHLDDYESQDQLEDMFDAGTPRLGHLQITRGFLSAESPILRQSPLTSLWLHFPDAWAEDNWTSAHWSLAQARTVLEGLPALKSLALTNVLERSPEDTYTILPPVIRLPYLKDLSISSSRFRECALMVDQMLLTPMTKVISLTSYENQDPLLLHSLASLSCIHASHGNMHSRHIHAAQWSWIPHDFQVAVQMWTRDHTSNRPYIELVVGTMWNKSSIVKTLIATLPLANLQHITFGLGFLPHWIQLFSPLVLVETVTINKTNLVSDSEFLSVFTEKATPPRHAGGTFLFPGMQTLQIFRCRLNEAVDSNVWTIMLGLQRMIEARRERGCALGTLELVECRVSAEEQESLRRSVDKVIVRAMTEEERQGTV
ncbi:hypothetical protein DXG01_003005 [Tephrocybe rancida]|nr:hypothetical protein DXG01_003005 [Tephrocybe rancida]